jgi:hypothetical protein
MERWVRGRLVANIDVIVLTGSDVIKKISHTLAIVVGEI